LYYQTDLMENLEVAIKGPGGDGNIEGAIGGGCNS
jgi:hypothetical protein